MKLFRSLFARTAVVIGVAILVYDLLTHAFLGYYLFMPMVKRSSDDLAAMMILTAESWRGHWAPERPALAERLAREYQLQLDADNRVLRPVESRSPYLRALADALERRSGEKIEILTSRDAGWYWVEIPVGREQVRIGFSAERVGIDPLVTVYFMLVFGSLLAFLTAIVFVRRINRPLARLVEVARGIGRGEFPDALPPYGARRDRGADQCNQSHEHTGEGTACRSHDDAGWRFSRSAHTARQNAVRYRDAVAPEQSQAGCGTAS
jgi:two-component system, OmpR family, osmolarity sensor histidine kinase EnvZ